MSEVLNSLIAEFRQLAAALPAPRHGSDMPCSIADAATSALVPFVLQSPSFLDSQRSIENSGHRSNSQSLFSIERIPSDNAIGSLLDGWPSDAFDSLFLQCLGTLRDYGALDPFLRLDNRILIALDGRRFHGFGAVRCGQCSARRVGASKSVQYFHSMVAGTVVADGHNRVIPLMPVFLRPQPDPAARVKQRRDCERQAARRWISMHAGDLVSYRPVFLGDGLYCWQPLCQLVLDHHADFIFVCKPASHKGLYDRLQESLYQSTGWVRVLGTKSRTTLHRYRWQSGVLTSEGEDAVSGTWIEYTVRRGRDAQIAKKTYQTRFFTSLEVTVDTVADITRAGRARWKIDRDAFHALASKANRLQHNFGHGSDGLANMLAVLSMLAFAFHGVLDGTCDTWRQVRQMLGTRRAIFQELGVITRLFRFKDWTHLLETMLNPPLVPGSLSPRRPA